jgi:AcrR family transcriptional regulator
MVRWEPGAATRLQAAAFDLYAATGFERTTVAEIASRAGVTERTFYRYFADKREVLFAGSGALQERMVTAVASSPPTIDVAKLVAVALAALAEFFPAERRAFAARRQAILDSQPALRERELLKQASLKLALAEVLVVQGVDRAKAAVAAESAIGVFTVSFARWLTEPGERGLQAVHREVLADLRAIVMWV